MKLGDLTVNERILLHLRDYMSGDCARTALVGQTQGGISEGIDIRINHIPRAVKKLLEDNYVEECLAHVGGLKRKRKVYVLTEAGMKTAGEMLECLKDQEIMVKFDDGREELKKIGGIPLTFNTTATLSQIILSAYSHGSVLESKLSVELRDDSSFISNLDMVPVPEEFIGRQNLVENLKANLNGDRKVTVVNGIKGIGKTSLVRAVLENFQNDRNILWFTAHEWDDVRSFLEFMAELLSHVDRDGTRRVLRSSKEITPSIAFQPFARDLQGLDSIVVIDNIFNLQKELMHVVKMMVENSDKLNDTNFIFITRDILTLKTGITPNSNVDYLTLEGLNPSEAKEMVTSKGVDISDEDFDIIYGITSGHPLALDLISSEFIETSFDTKGLTREELLMVKCLKAFDSIFQ